MWPPANITVFMFDRDTDSPLNCNLQVSHSYIASILSKCFKNWAGLELMK